MIIPPIKPASRRRSAPSRHRSRAGRRPRVPAPIPAEPAPAPTALVSILPPALQALLEALPPEAHLPLELLAPLVVERTPLAGATLSLWAYLLKPADLDAIFDRHRGRSFEDTLHFDAFVELIRDALVLHNGSGRQSFQRAREQGELPTREEAVYGKLRRIPIPLSAGFFEDISGLMRPLLPTGHAIGEVPASLAGMTVVVLDGKQIKDVAKRLKAVRGRPGKVIGGKILVAYLPGDGPGGGHGRRPRRRGQRHPADARRRSPAPAPASRASRLWVADRQFCDLDQPAPLTEQGDHFLIRRTLRTGFHADPDRAGADGRRRAGPRGRRAVGLARRGDGEAAAVRAADPPDPPGRGGGSYLVTDLLDEPAYPAEDLLTVYLAAMGDRAGIPADHRGLQPAAADRQHAGGDGLPGGVLPGAVQPAAGDAGLCGGRPGRAVRRRSVSMEQIFVDVQKELTALTELFAAGGRSPAGMPRSWSREERGGSAGWAAGRCMDAPLPQGGQQEAATEGEEGQVLRGPYVGPQGPRRGTAEARPERERDVAQS